MMHIWEYQCAASVVRRGVMLGFSDRGGTDVTYKFHRLDNAGRPIRYPNGGIMADMVSGPRLKLAKHMDTMTLADYQRTEAEAA
jgi:hypothetical protein